ncbi:MAG: quinoprotein glucose dehydrogenase, partial [Nitrososphaera sp.]
GRRRVLDNEADAAVARPQDDKSVVLRVDRNTGAPVSDNPFYGDDERLARYYAYGIRNSFGMDFDPLTGTLWMTENGPDSYDEINVVRPGFNSGWHKLTGPMGRWPGMTEDSLMQLQGSHYQDPVFSWKQPVGVTD